MTMTTRTSASVGSLAIALLLGGTAASGAAAASPAPHRFSATVTEDFAFLGCAFPVDPLAVDLCGAASTNLGKPFRVATTTTVITGFDPLPTGCYRDTHLTTLAFSDEKRSSVTLALVGDLCPTGGGNISFTGTYQVVGGTGEMRHASGRGVATAVRQGGPVVETLVGSLDD